MGVDIDLYRCRIGTFHRAPRGRIKGSLSPGSETQPNFAASCLLSLFLIFGSLTLWLMQVPDACLYIALSVIGLICAAHHQQAKDLVTILPFQVLLMLLLIAGVEPSLVTVVFCEAFVLGNTLASVALLPNYAELHSSSTLYGRHQFHAHSHRPAEELSPNSALMRSSYLIYWWKSTVGKVWAWLLGAFQLHVLLLCVKEPNLDSNLIHEDNTVASVASIYNILIDTLSSLCIPSTGGVTVETCVLALCFIALTQLRCSYYPVCTFVWSLSAQALKLMLLIAGVESNPGPSHLCKVCKMDFSSISAYCTHSSVHQSRRHQGILCSFQSCNTYLKNQASFATHFSTFHAKHRECLPVENVRNILCPSGGCEYPVKSLDDYRKHVAAKHFGAKTEIQATPFTCLFKGCSTMMRKLTQFRTHLSSFHGKEETDAFFQVGREESLPPPAEMDMDFDTSTDADPAPGESDMDFTSDTPAPETTEVDLFPDHVVKEALSKFYLQLESDYALPTTTVQAIAMKIKLVSELIHYRLKKTLTEELSSLNMGKELIEKVIRQAFAEETVFNIHHKGLDSVQLATDSLRVKHWRTAFKFVRPKPVHLGEKHGKKRFAHFISIRESLAALLEDNDVKAKVLESFEMCPRPEGVYADFTDGSFFKEHIKCHEHDGGKCLQLLLFQDAFDPSAFCGSGGAHKPLGFYWTLGNLPSEIRSRLNLINMAYMVLEKDTKNSMADELKNRDLLKKALEPLIADLVDLRINGIMLNGEKIPVCLIFLLGDSLGQHFIGRYIQSFSAEYSCRFCTITKSEFKDKPYLTKCLRTPAEYDEFKTNANRYWQKVKTQSLAAQVKAREARKKKLAKQVQQGAAPPKETPRDLESPISASNYKRLTAISFRGVKYRQSPFNKEELNFHVVGQQPPCLAHDLFEGIIKNIVPKILKHFIVQKKWFDLSTLNERIMSFKCLGTDINDKPKPLKSFDSLSGHAVENWNFLRLLPFIISDLIQDQNDPYWLLLVALIKICAFACAPKISAVQIERMRLTIENFACQIKTLLPDCLIPKLHFLCHYPELIYIFGPLIGLFTLRFESRHMYFKTVMRNCKNFTNVTHTMSRKYACKNAFDRSCNLLQADVIYQDSKRLDSSSMPPEVRSYISKDMEELNKVSIFGTEYKENQFLILGGHNVSDIKVGCIKKVILKVSTNKVIFLLEELVATDSLSGYYCIQKSNTASHLLMKAEDLPDYYPLPAYPFDGKLCLALKHTSIAMQ